MSIEQQALDFVNSLQEIYLEQRDIHRIIGLMDNDISYIGTGVNEICTTIEQARLSLEKEGAEASGSFTIAASWHRTMQLSEEICVVYGEVRATPADSPLGIADPHFRLTVVCHLTPHGMRLCHVHLSEPDIYQREGEHFATNKTRADNTQLRSLVARAEKDLQERDRELEVITDNIPGGVHQRKNDPAFTMVSMSEGFIKMFGYSRHEIKEQFENSFTAMIYRGDRQAVEQAMEEQLSKGETVEFEYRVRCKNGSLIWILDRGRLVTAGDGSQWFFCIMIDITDRKSEQEALRLSLERHQVIMNQATDIIFEWDIGKDTLEYSSNWHKKFGYAPVRTEISQKLPVSDNVHPDDMATFVKLMKDSAAGTPYSETEFRIRNCAGIYRWFRIRATVQFGYEGAPLKAVGVIVDVDAEKKQRQLLMDQARRDPLTGLYNKSSINFIIEEYMNADEKDMPCGLMMIDIDYFKGINDSYGHLCGDKVLIAVAATLKRLFRVSDAVGRVGGDEFMVFLTDVGEREVIEQKAAQLIQSMTAITPYEGAPPVTCSVGAVFSACEERTLTQLCHRADLALYNVKENGRNGFAVYNSSMDKKALPCQSLIEEMGEIMEDSEMSDVDERLAQYVFRTLYSSKGVNASVEQLLEFVGKVYDVSRAYVFEPRETGMGLSRTFEWVASGTVRKELPEKDAEVDSKWYMSLYGDDSVFYCDNVTKLKGGLLTTALQQGVQSMLHCRIMDRQRMAGVIGFDECRKGKTWTKQQVSSLGLISRILADFIMKQRLRERLDRYENK